MPRLRSGQSIIFLAHRRLSGAMVERRRPRPRGTERKGPLHRMLRGEGVAARVRSGEGVRVPKQDRMGLRERLPKLDKLSPKLDKITPYDTQVITTRPIRRRRKETPEQVVARFRARFPDLDIPDPGPEPQPLEGPLEPSAIELAGTTWALKTAEGIAASFGLSKEEEDAFLKSLIPGLLDSREIWERRTAEGVREFIMRSLEKGT